MQRFETSPLNLTYKEDPPGFAPDAMAKAIDKGKAITPTVTPAMILGSQLLERNKPALTISMMAIMSDFKVPIGYYQYISQRWSLKYRFVPNHPQKCQITSSP